MMNIYGMKPFEHLLKNVNAQRYKQIVSTLKPVEPDVQTDAQSKHNTDTQQSILNKTNIPNNHDTLKDIC